MKELSAILKQKYGNSATAKRAQLRNEILVRGDEILAELAKGWSLRAIWTALSEHKELTCGYKTFIAHVRRLNARINFGFSYFMQALIYVVMIVIHCDIPTLCLS